LLPFGGISSSNPATFAIANPAEVGSLVLLAVAGAGITC
jgi:hypothetical protein